MLQSDGHCKAYPAFRTGSSGGCPVTLVVQRLQLCESWRGLLQDQELVFRYPCSALLRSGPRVACVVLHGRRAQRGAGGVSATQDSPRG